MKITDKLMVLESIQPLSNEEIMEIQGGNPALMAYFTLKTIFACFDYLEAVDREMMYQCNTNRA